MVSAGWHGVPRTHWEFGHSCGSRWTRRCQTIRRSGRTRRLIDIETHCLAFVWLLEILAEHGLLRGHTIGIDATTLEANAALRSIVRRDTGEQ